VGIANIINILSPQAVILTGGLIGAWDILVEEAKKEASRRAFKNLYDRVKILPSSLGGDDSGVLGAAALILHEKRVQH
jgi:glucokinase